MNFLALSDAARIGSARHRKVHRYDSVLEMAALLLRLAAAGLLSAVGWIHLHLWHQGYRYIPTIGALFLAAAITTFVVAAGLLVRPNRLMGLIGFGTVVGLVAGLFLSVIVGLFGFKESLLAPYVAQSIALELAAAVILAGWIAVDFTAESRQRSRLPEVTRSPSSDRSPEPVGP
jgi:hypothetical protein